MEITLHEPLFDARHRPSAERITCASLGFRVSAEVRKQRELVAEGVIRRERERYATKTLWNLPHNAETARA